VLIIPRATKAKIKAKGGGTDLVTSCMTSIWLHLTRHEIKSELRRAQLCDPELRLGGQGTSGSYSVLYLL